jgi:Ca2+-binding EF-hand superfamily protein
VICPIRLKAITNGKVDDKAISDMLRMADSDDDGEINYENYLSYLLEDERPFRPSKR